MNEQDGQQILSQFNILTTITENGLKEVVSDYQNYKMIAKTTDKMWAYGIYMIEREQTPYFKVEKEFDTLIDAVKYFVIKLISANVTLTRYQEFKRNNRELRIGFPDYDVENMLKALQVANISSDYISFDDSGLAKEKIRINVKTVENKQYRIQVISSNGILHESKSEMDRQTALSLATRKVYLLNFWIYEVMPVFENYGHIDIINNEDVLNFIN